jgi:transposase
MYLRATRKTVDGQSYQYWTLVESVRTARGPRQEVVAQLGKLPGLGDRPEAGWEEISCLLEGEPGPEQLELGQPSKPVPEPQWREVNVRGVRVERVRAFGEVYLALALWRRLGLHQLFQELMEPGKEAIGWETVACVLTVARFCAEPSELGVAQRWYGQTALEDLLGLSVEKLNDDRLYRGLDVLLAHKEQLTTHLLQRYESWFGVNFEFLIYDVTSTFFEGRCEANEQAARGYSRDNRPDCKQVCIGLVVSAEGLPLAYELFAGNRTDVTTVQEIILMMENKYGKAQRIWVIDRGLVSEENIDFLRQRGAHYLVGTPRSQLRKFEAALLDKAGWEPVREGVEVKLVAHPDGRGREQFVLCRSQARREKDRAILARQEKRLLEQLLKIDHSLRQRPKDAQPIERRIGRWLGRNPVAEHLFEVRVLKDARQQACGLSLACRLDRGRWQQQVEGAYLLRTDCLEKSPAKLWQWYLQLEQAESAFRTAKSDLRLRPIFHQKAQRVEAHILVCFLALALRRTLEMWMKAKGLGNSSRQLIAQIATIKSLDVVLPVRTAEGTAEMRLRTTSKPEKMVAELLHRLGLRVPGRSKLIENVVTKNGI